MATGITLDDAQLRALRIIAAHPEVPELDRTDADVPCVAAADADALGRKWLATRTVLTPGPSVWCIRAKGRQVLREHDAAGAS